MTDQDLINAAELYTKRLKAFNNAKSVAETARNTSALWGAEEYAMQQSFWEASKALTELLEQRAKE